MIKALSKLLQKPAIALIPAGLSPALQGTVVREKTTPVSAVVTMYHGSPLRPRALSSGKLISPKLLRSGDRPAIVRDTATLKRSIREAELGSAQAYEAEVSRVDALIIELRQIVKQWEGKTGGTASFRLSTRVYDCPGSPGKRVANYAYRITVQAQDRRLIQSLFECLQTTILSLNLY